MNKRGRPATVDSNTLFAVCGRTAGTKLHREGARRILIDAMVDRGGRCRLGELISECGATAQNHLIHLHRAGWVVMNKGDDHFFKGEPKAINITQRTSLAVDGRFATVNPKRGSKERAVINRILDVGGRSNISCLNKHFGFDCSDIVRSLVVGNWLA